MKRIALVPVLALLAACGGAPPAGGGHQMPPPPVTVVPVVERVEAEWSEVTGRIEPVALVEIRSRVAGFVEEVSFREGALVKKGDVLFAIDRRPFEAAVLRAEAAVANATARFELAQRDAARSKELLEAEAISKETADQRAAAVAVGQAELRAAEAAVTTAKLELGYAGIVAPIAGKVGRTLVTAGNLVGVGTQVLTTIVSVDPVYVTFDLDERTFASARAMLTATGDAKPAAIEVATEGEDGFPHRGEIDFIDNHLDPSTGTIRLRAVLPNPDGALVPGAFARVRLPISAAVPRLLVDQRAIATDQDAKYVLVLGEGNVTGYRRVELGPPVGPLRMVRSGLVGGETVLLRGNTVFVHPGMPVSPVPEAATPPADAHGGAPAGPGDAPADAVPAAAEPAPAATQATPSADAPAQPAAGGHQ
jgi:multidrug efflux system membrane fusion protein